MAAGRVRPARMADRLCPTASDTSPGLVTRWTSVRTAASAPDLVADFVEESVAAPGVGQRHTGADEEDGNRIGEGLEQGGKCVEHGRAGGRDDDVDLTGCPGRTVGHIAGTLFVAR
jgi:hypothetical protein